MAHSKATAPDDEPVGRNSTIAARIRRIDSLPTLVATDGLFSRQVSPFAKEVQAEEVVARMGSKTGLELMRGVAAVNRGDFFDLLVLGAGPAGLRAAVEAASRGHRVGLIDPKASITGAPTGAHSKALREAALCGATTWAEVEQVKNNTIQGAIRASARQMRIFLVEHLQGIGKLHDETHIVFTPTDRAKPTKALEFNALVIATGSQANRFPPVNFDLPGVYDSDTVSMIDRIPERLVVQGAGIIGLEYALIFKKLGCKSVVVVDIFDQVVPMLDSSLQEACKQTMASEGIELVMKTKFTQVEALPDSTALAPKIRVTCEGGKILDCDCLLSACGRSGVTKNLGLESLAIMGLQVGRGGFVQVDENGYTGVAGIYAVGDCAGGNLATIGQEQAVRSMRKHFGSGMLSKETRMSAKPLGVWTIPEMAWAGVTEEKARSDGLDIGTVTVKFNRTVRGCVTHQEGFLKMVYHGVSGKVLGVHMFGEQSCDLINYGAEAVCDGDTVYDILQFVFPAVTYHELYTLAAQEAKLKIMHRGAKSLTAATAWERVEVALAKSCQEEGKTIREVLHVAFRYFDLDSSGYITPEQLKAALKGLGMQLSDEHIMKMVVEATGSDEDEHIEYEDFLRIFNVEPERGIVGKAEIQQQGL
uniref:NAD(P)(+) transhydrogenase (Si-specific) n=1 Tax=Zooxanthella nutricula TaxID=1333877 RepID=A0A7S2QP51_9DINO